MPVRIQFRQAMVSPHPEMAAPSNHALDVGGPQFTGARQEPPPGAQSVQALQGADPGPAPVIGEEGPDILGDQSAPAMPLLDHALALLPEEDAVVASHEHAVPGQFQEADHGSQPQVRPGIRTADQTAESLEWLGPQVVSIGADPQGSVPIPEGAVDRIATRQAPGIEELVVPLGTPQIEAIGPEHQDEFPAGLGPQSGHGHHRGQARQRLHAPGALPGPPQQVSALQRPELPRRIHLHGDDRLRGQFRRQGDLVQPGAAPAGQGSLFGTDPEPVLGVHGHGRDGTRYPGLRQWNPLKPLAPHPEQSPLGTRHQHALPGLGQAVDGLVLQAFAGAETGDLPAPDSRETPLLGGHPDGTLPVLQQAGDVLGPEPVGSVEKL